MSFSKKSAFEHADLVNDLWMSVLDANEETGQHRLAQMLEKVIVYLVKRSTTIEPPAKGDAAKIRVCTGITLPDGDEIEVFVVYGENCVITDFGETIGWSKQVDMENLVRNNSELMCGTGSFSLISGGSRGGPLFEKGVFRANFDPSTAPAEVEHLVGKVAASIFIVTHFSESERERYNSGILVRIPKTDKWVNSARIIGTGKRLHAKGVKVLVVDGPDILTTATSGEVMRSINAQLQKARRES